MLLILMLLLLSLPVRSGECVEELQTLRLNENPVLKRHKYTSGFL